MADVVHELIEVLAFCGDIVPGKLRFNASDDRRQLARFVIGLGKQESKVTFPAKLLNGPAIRSHAILSAARIRQQNFFAPLHWSEYGNTRKSAGLEAKLAVGLFCFPLPSRIRLIEKKQVLAFNIENDGVGVSDFVFQNAAVEKPVKKKRGVACLRSDARNS